MRRKPTVRRFVLCVKNDECDDLVTRKVYRVIPDEKAEKDGYVRVIDESGEDYLYPASYFVRVQLPQEVAKVFRTSESVNEVLRTLVRVGRKQSRKLST